MLTQKRCFLNIALTGNDVRRPLVCSNTAQPIAAAAVGWLCWSLCYILVPLVSASLYRGRCMTGSMVGTRIFDAIYWPIYLISLQQVMIYSIIVSQGYLFLICTILFDFLPHFTFLKNRNVSKSDGFF